MDDLPDDIWFYILTAHEPREDENEPTNTSAEGEIG